MEYVAKFLPDWEWELNRRKKVALVASSTGPHWLLRNPSFLDLITLLKTLKHAYARSKKIACGCVVLIN